MWVAQKRGELKGTVKSLAAMVGATPEEMLLFLTEAKETGFATITCNGDVMICNSHVTVQNRRMIRDEKDRELNRIRVSRHRTKKECNGNVTPPLASASASACTKVHSILASDEPEKDFIWARSGKRKRKLTGWKLDDFLSFWKAYAYPHGRAEAADAWLEIDDLTHEMVEARIIPAAKREAAGRAALKAKGLTPKMAQGWLNARRFDDEPPKNGKSTWDRGVFR